jgi:tetratricopeptide (TPR) repeat protein
MNFVLKFLLLLLGIFSFYAQCYQNDTDAAKVIQQSGLNQWRTAITSPWISTEINQGLTEGSHVKTGKQSKIALLFRDNSQLRLNQNSLLIIKDVLDEQGNSTRFRLNQGRAWVKSKNIPDKLIMETPSAVAAIRGTDWDIEVNKNGRTTITVLHGSIHFYNDLGSVTVDANEQARADIGKAPIKIYVANPKKRIQWVTEYQINPLRYAHLVNPMSSIEQQLIRDFSVDSIEPYRQQLNVLPISPFTLALKSDLLLYQGNPDNVINLLAQYPTIKTLPELRVLEGKAKLMQGNPSYLTNTSNLIVIDLFNAEVALFNGEGDRAIALYEKILKVKPENQQSWYQLGKIYTEKENLDLAFSALNKAIALVPKDAKAHTEKATLLTLTNQFDQAEMSFDIADKNSANQALTLTGRGVLALKQGQTTQAINYFLQAGTLAPKLARIQSYLAVSYYQLAQVDLARKTLAYASELDPNDPMPYFMLTNIEREHYRPQAALSASKSAIARLTNVKSLNQLANNLTGSTNLGAALAEFGMNDWATKYAVDSYDPFWAGSQLFLSNRFDNDRYVQQSELYKGILNDPISFGASKRYSEIIAKPGVHGSLRFNHLKTKKNDGFELKNNTPTLTLNGMNNAVIPVAFFIEQFDAENNFSNYRSESQLYANTPTQYSRIGLGIKVTPKLSAFYYKNKGNDDSNLVTKSAKLLTNNTDKKSNIDDNYYGLQYQLSPEHDISVSYLSFDSSTHQKDETSYFNKTINGDYINEISYSGLIFTEVLKSTDSSQFSWRYRNVDQHFFNIGFSVDKNIYQNNNKSEVTSHNKMYVHGKLTSDINQYSKTKINFTEKNTIEQSYFHWQSSMEKRFSTDLLLSFHKTSIDNHNIIPGFTHDIKQFSNKGLSVGAGVKYNFNSQWLIRSSYQDWLNSGAIITSGPSMLAGVPFSSEYSLMGTDIQRSVIQVEYNNDSVFLQLFAEQQAIDNSQFPKNFANSSIDILSSELRQLSAINNDISKIYQNDNQFVGQPKYTIVQAKVSNYHLLLNGFITERLSGNIGYRHTDAQQWDPSADRVEDTAKFDMLNQAQSRFRFGLNYSASFSATPFVQASYYDYPSNTTDLENGWIWNIGWRQEFWKKRLLFTAQHIIRDTDNSKTWHVVGELRF